MHLLRILFGLSCSEFCYRGWVKLETSGICLWIKERRLKTLYLHLIISTIHISFPRTTVRLSQYQIKSHSCELMTHALKTFSDCWKSNNTLKNAIKRIDHHPYHLFAKKRSNRSQSLKVSSQETRFLINFVDPFYALRHLGRISRQLTIGNCKFKSKTIFYIIDG